MSQYGSHSPPPLRHPVPTHPAYIPEPPSTPASPQGYQRFSSSPGPNQPPHQQQQHAQAYPTHVPAYTTPFQHAQPPMAQPPYPAGGMHHMPPSQHAPAQQHPPPQQMQGADYAAWGLDGATAQLGMQLGQSAVAAGQDYVQRNFGTMIPSNNVKHYFNVSNSYVIKKLRLLLFPWIHKSYFRRPRGAQGEWLPPREDLNSPDLYIPVMAIFTYILLSTLHSGIIERFSPLILGESASRATAVVLCDFAFVKLGCYILNIPSSQMVDLIAYGGYKFVGIIFTIAAGFLGVKGLLWTLVFLYAFAANAFFLLRSLRAVILPDASATPAQTGTVTQAQRRRRIVFLFLEALMQIFYMGWLVRI
ncbi:protein transporter yif1 [Pholiota molesta]|nr:protein transporter yif1 [Pholiota molesta]